MADETQTVEQEKPTGAAPEEKNVEVVFTPEQQKHVDSIISDRLKRAKTSWEADSKAAQQKAQEKAEADRLKEQNEFKTLAEKQQARLDALEPQFKTTSEQNERYKSALEKQLAKAKEGLSKPILTLLERMDVVEQMEWLAENAGQVELPKVKGPDPTPKPNGNDQLNDEQRRAKAAQARNYW